MNVHPDPEELMAWHDGEVRAERATDLSAHVNSCAACQAAIGEFERVSDSLARWTVPPPSERLQPPAATTSRIVSTASVGATTRMRRVFYWAAAAVVVVGILASVRVECAPAPTCERRTWHLSFFPRSEGVAPVPAQARAMSPAQRVAFERYWNAKPRFDGHPRARGAVERMELVLFLDWQCPACRIEYRAYHPVFEEFLGRERSRISVSYRDYPLSKRCNIQVPIELHSSACEAAAAVRAARMVGTDAAMIEWLFANQESLTPDLVRDAARTVGHVSDFDTQLTSRPMRALIERDVQDAVTFGVTSTPTLFINGVLARGEANRLFTAEEVRAAIEIELARIR